MSDSTIQMLSPSSSATQTPAVQPEKVEPERPQKPEAGKNTRAQWKEVNMVFTAPQSQKLEFEPEYDPDSLDEEESPLFDLGSRAV
jgi:hypothetical protein